MLYAKQVADSGPGSPSNSTLSSYRRLPPDGWWPLAVAGGS